MKYNFVLTLIVFLFSFFSLIKSEESNHPILDFDLSSVDDNILKSFEDFDFIKDKKDTLNIKQKMKKVACLNIITNVIKQSKSDIKQQIKNAKNENKNNFNIFINNMTNTCIQIIKEKDIAQILNHENFENKRFPLGKEDIKFKEHLREFLEDNERIKKMEEMKIARQKRNKMIFNSVIVGTVVLVILILFNLLRKKKKGNNNDDKNEKKSGHKKKNKNKEN